MRKHSRSEQWHQRIKSKWVLVCPKSIGDEMWFSLFSRSDFFEVPSLWTRCLRIVPHWCVSLYLSTSLSLARMLFRMQSARQDCYCKRFRRSEAGTVMFLFWARSLLVLPAALKRHIELGANFHYWCNVEWLWSHISNEVILMTKTDDAEHSSVHCHCQDTFVSDDSSMTTTPWTQRSEPRNTFGDIFVCYDVKCIA